MNVLKIYKINEDFERKILFTMKKPLYKNNQQKTIQKVHN